MRTLSRPQANAIVGAFRAHRGTPLMSQYMGYRTRRYQSNLAIVRLAFRTIHSLKRAQDAEHEKGR